MMKRTTLKNPFCDKNRIASGHETGIRFNLFTSFSAPCYRHEHRLRYFISNKLTLLVCTQYLLTNIAKIPFSKGGMEVS